VASAFTRYDAAAPNPVSAMQMARTTKMNTYFTQSESQVCGVMPKGREMTKDSGDTKTTSNTVRISSAREVRSNFEGTPG